MIGETTFNTYGTLHVLKGYKDVYSNAEYWTNFTIVDDLEPLKNSIELADGTDYDRTTKITYDMLTYTRSFSNTNWQALYIPFSMSYDDWKDEFEVAMINDVNMYDNNDDGEIDETEVELVKIKKGTTVPNHPYFIRAKKAGEKTITVENATLYPSKENSIDCSSVSTKFTFTGTYSGVSGSEMVNNHYYALSGGTLSYTTNSSVSLKPYRWYMNIEDRGGKQVILPTAQVRLRVIGEADDATEIDDVKVAAEADAKVYSLDGRVVSYDGNTSSLKKGIYIKNNKKFVVR